MVPARNRWSVVVCALALAVALAFARGTALGADEAIDQTTRLAALAKVWGLIKYFHPQVAQGTVDWDAALVSAIPRVKAAETKPAFSEEIMRLVHAGGGTPRLPIGEAIDQPEADAAFSWLDDEQLFDRATMAALKTIRHAERPTSNRYVKAVPSILNPDFGGEAPYDSPLYPNEGMRLLALFRFWNMVHFSGLGVFYPDGTPTQRVGIVPDVIVSPTVEGTQNGVDEVLARALALLR